MITSQQYPLMEGQASLSALNALQSPMPGGTSVPLCYIASAYSYNLNEGYWNAIAGTGLLTRLGLLVYSPIVHFHTVAEQHALPTDVGFWWHINESMLQRCDALVVLDAGPWRQSTGVTTELAWWRKNKQEKLVPPAPALLVSLSDLEALAEEIE